MGFGYVLDGVYGTGGQVQQSEAWAVSAFYEHYWNPAWRTSVFGNYSHISYGDAGNALLFDSLSAGRTNNAGFLAPGTTGNFDLGLIQIGTRTAWTPVRNLTLSAQFTYSRLEQNLNGGWVGGITGKTTPAGGFTLSNQNHYNGSVQILRSF